MKLAVCFAGQARYTKATYPSLKQHLLDLYDCDVYVHSWNYDDRIGEPYIPCLPERGIIRSDYRSSIVELYRPKAVVFETPLYNVIKSSVFENRIRMQLYSKKAVVELALASNVHYDGLVVLRTDLMLESNYDLALDDLDKLTCRIWHPPGRNVIADRILAGSPEIISQATLGTYHELLTRGSFKPDGDAWWGEEFLWFATQNIEKRIMKTRLKLYRKYSMTEDDIPP